MEVNEALVVYTVVDQILFSTPIVAALVIFGRYRRKKNTKWSKKRTVAAYLAVIWLGAFVGGLLRDLLHEFVPPPF